MVNRRSDFDHLFHCLMDRYHYLGCRGHVGEHMKYMVYDRYKRPLAGLLFGSAAWKTTPRDRYIGWNAGYTPRESEAVNQQHPLFDSTLGSRCQLGQFHSGCLSQAVAVGLVHALWPMICAWSETFVDRSRFTGTC